MAQSVENRHQIEGAMLSYYNTYGREYFSLSLKNKAFAFGFVIGVNKNGKVDTVIFTNQTKKLDSLVSFETMRKKIKRLKGFETSKNTAIVGVVLIRRERDSAITNFYDHYMRRQYKEIQDFDQYFTGMIPTIPSYLEGRKIILLPAFGFVQVEPKY
jgi:hypothetical protein